jgi:hypothetical protein
MTEAEEGLVQTMKRSLEDSGLSKDKVDEILYRFQSKLKARGNVLVVDGNEVDPLVGQMMEAFRKIHSQSRHSQMSWTLATAIGYDYAQGLCEEESSTANKKTEQIAMHH